MAVFVTLASGSSGNAALFSDGNTHVLIDAGISFRRLREELRRFDIAAEDLSAVFITHEHIDHTRGLRQLMLHSRAPLFISRGTACRVTDLPDGADVRYIAAGSEITLGGVTVNVFATPHDTSESIGFTLHAAGHKLAYFTDIGVVTPVLREAILGAECVFIESNHDVDRLVCGAYPERLKQRILSSRGHLSNDDCAVLVCEAAAAGAQRITLCHLSKENNTPALAACASLEALADAGFDCVSVCVAPPDRACAPYIFEC